MWFFRASPCQYILEMLEFTKLKIFFKKTCKLEWNYEGFLHTFTSEGYLLVNQLLMWKKSESPNNLCTWNYNEEINHYDMFIICNYYSFIDHCVKSVQIRSYFWSVFSCIWTEYRDLLLKSPYWVRKQENTDQK